MSSSEVLAVKEEGVNTASPLTRPVVSPDILKGLEMFAKVMSPVDSKKDVKVTVEDIKPFGDFLSHLLPVCSAYKLTIPEGMDCLVKFKKMQ